MLGTAYGGQAMQKLSKYRHRLQNPKAATGGIQHRKVQSRRLRTGPEKVGSIIKGYEAASFEQVMRMENNPPKAGYNIEGYEAAGFEQESNACLSVGVPTDRNRCDSICRIISSPSPQLNPDA